MASTAVCACSRRSSEIGELPAASAAAMRSIQARSFVAVEALMLAAYLALAWMAARERPP